MIKIKKFQFSFFGVNTYVVTDVATGETAIIDPAMHNEQEQDELDSYISDNKLKVTQIINTHMHLDHCFGVDYVKSRYDVPLKAHSLDAVLGNMMKEQFMMFGLTPSIGNVSIDVPLVDGDVIELGETRFEVIHTPGHTRGGISFYDAVDKVVFTGDSLFGGSIGRTDLPGGDYQQLINSIRSRLFTLPADTVIYPGHLGTTTIGKEKATNSYVI